MFFATLWLLSKFMQAITMEKNIRAVKMQRTFLECVFSFRLSFLFTGFLTFKLEKFKI